MQKLVFAAVCLLAVTAISAMPVADDERKPAPADLPALSVVPLEAAKDKLQEAKPVEEAKKPELAAAAAAAAPLPNEQLKEAEKKEEKKMEEEKKIEEKKPEEMKAEEKKAEPEAKKEEEKKAEEPKKAEEKKPEEELKVAPSEKHEQVGVDCS